MSKLGIYIVEDEELFANQLEMLVDQLGYELIGVSDNSDIAKKEIEAKKPDLILMDIKVNGSMNGIDLAASLPYQAAVIFITSFADEATFQRAKNTRPHAYITKPFDAEHLQRTIELALGNLAPSESWEKEVVFEKAIFIKVRHRLVKVPTDQIAYLEVEDRYCTLGTDSGKKYVIRMSMSEVLAKLPPGDFMRIHRKYAISLAKVSSIDTQDNLILIGEAPFPVSRTHKEELLNKLNWLQ